MQLFYSVRNIFELFCDVVPVYHKQTLELPQMAAIHCNNSMYLAHHCITMGHQFRPTLPDSLGQGAATFLDLVPVLRNCGQKCFLENLVRKLISMFLIAVISSIFCNTYDVILSRL